MGRSPSNVNGHVGEDKDVDIERPLSSGIVGLDEHACMWDIGSKVCHHGQSELVGNRSGYAVLQQEGIPGIIVVGLVRDDSNMERDHGDVVEELLPCKEGSGLNVRHVP